MHTQCGGSVRSAQLVEEESRRWRHEEEGTLPARVVWVVHITQEEQDARDHVRLQVVEARVLADRVVEQHHRLRVGRRRPARHERGAEGAARERRSRPHGETLERLAVGAGCAEEEHVSLRDDGAADTHKRFDEGRDARALARMRRTVEDMEGLIQTLLLLARGEEVEQPGVRLRLNDLVPELIDQVTPLATDRGIKLVLVESADLWVQAPDRVVQILIINLLRNGINYTPQGQVQVEIKNNSVTVKDTGIGMTSSELNQAFEPFYRSERGRTNGPGHGLGLSIVRRLVHQFEWKISVQSNVGEGTEVTINFG